jgi:hypothetical protein
LHFAQVEHIARPPVADIESQRGWATEVAHPHVWWQVVWQGDRIAVSAATAFALAKAEGTATVGPQARSRARPLVIGVVPSAAATVVGFIRATFGKIDRRTADDVRASSCVARFAGVVGGLST